MPRRIRRFGNRLWNYGDKLVGGEEIRRGASFISQSVSFLAGRHKSKRHREETFANACERMGLNKPWLIEKYEQFYVTFMMFVLLGVLDIGSMIWLIFHHYWIGVLPCLAMFLVCVSQIFSNSFRAYQIRTQELSSPNEWMHNMGAWWPPSKKAVFQNWHHKPNSHSRDLTTTKSHDHPPHPHQH